MDAFFGLDGKVVAVDADSVEVRLRRIIIKACARRGVAVLFVSDRPLGDVSEAHISNKSVRQVIVRSDFDSADDFILEHADRILFCVTHDRILQRKLEERGALFLDKRGCRSVGAGGLAARSGLTAKSVEVFSNALESLLREVSGGKA